MIEEIVWKLMSKNALYQPAELDKTFNKWLFTQPSEAASLLSVSLIEQNYRLYNHLMTLTKKNG